MTEKEKQIEEMVKDIGEKQTMGELCIGAISDKSLQYEIVSNNELAEHLYNADYRKVEQGEWISVEDRLPETEGDYLVWNKEQNRVEKRFFYRLPPNYPVESYPEIREYFGNVSDYRKITHWMPLPKPPKMKGAE